MPIKANENHCPEQNVVWQSIVTMGSPPILLSSFLLLLLLSPGFGGEVLVEAMEHGDSLSPSKLESGGKSRKMMIGVTDYHDPCPNHNTKFKAPPPGIEVMDYPDPHPSHG